MKRVIVLVSLLLFTACPPPSYKLRFRVDAKITDKSVFKDDSVSVAIAGYHMPLTSEDYVYIDFHFEKMNEINQSFCENAIQVESNRYEMSEFTGLIWGLSSECSLNLYYPHKQLTSMNLNEFNNYLDSTYIEISLRDVADSTIHIYPMFDKKWSEKRLWKYIKAE